MTIGPVRNQLACPSQLICLGITQPQTIHQILFGHKGKICPALKEHLKVKGKIITEITSSILEELGSVIKALWHPKTGFIVLGNH